MFSFFEFNLSNYLFIAIICFQFAMNLKSEFVFKIRMGRSSGIKRSQNLSRGSTMTDRPEFFSIVVTPAKLASPLLPDDPNCTADSCGL